MDTGTPDVVLSLYERLRSEKLMVSNEIEILRDMNKVFADNLAHLEEQIWITQQEKGIWKRFKYSDPSVHPENVGRLLKSLQATKFILGHRVLNHNASLITEILRTYYQHPRALAECLNSVEVSVNKNMVAVSVDDVCRCVFNVIFGASILPMDEKTLLEVLANLISLQLTSKSDPRRYLRKGASVFCKMYSLFSEQLFSAKVFLTAALHEPIMTLLSQDETFLDVDPSKSPIRLTPEERKRRFGLDENSAQYKEKQASYRRSIVEKLFRISLQFVKSIQQAVCCFPASLIWLVRQLKASLLDRKRVNKEEAELICTDLIFTNFICPAMINPEPHGIISDTPIGHVARFNLMQVGQIIQSLALCPYEEQPAYMNGILQMFSDNPMPEFVKNILKYDVMSLGLMFPVVVKNDEGQELYNRRNFLGTIEEIQLMADCLKGNVDAISDETTRNKLKQLAKRLPDDLASCKASREDFGTPKAPLPRSSSGRLRIFADKVQTVAKTQHQKLLTNLPGSNGINEEKMENIVEEVLEVLVFEFSNGFVPIGMEPEEKIMNNAKTKAEKKFNSSESLIEKKTRFKTTESVVSDHTGTTDAPSDDEEIDEAEGGGSLCSSMNDNMADEEDDEDDDPEEVSTLPDNFSDMVPISANVSGRGSPSLSGGRETPFSMGGGAPPPDQSVTSMTVNDVNANSSRSLPRLPVTVRKQNAEGLEEKFGKFGLPAHDVGRNRDETYSLVSDSWSTDVVASDNEGLNDQKQEQSLGPLPPPIPPRLHESQSTGQIIDIGDNNVNQPGPSGFAPLPPLPAPVSLSLSDRERIADDILNKYRSPVTPSSSSGPLFRPAEIRHDADEPSMPYFDSSNITKCKAFADAKRKIRLVLSSAENIPTNVTSKYSTINTNLNVVNNDNDSSVTRLDEFLRFLLAESINNQNRTLTAQIREVRRCLSVFDSRGIRKLFRTLRDEHRRRTSYLMYLQQSRLSLLQLNSYLKKLLMRIEKEKKVMGDCLVDLLVRYYLERKEKFIKKFITDFRRLKVQDERMYAVERTLDSLFEQICSEQIWRDFSPDMINAIKKNMDRNLMGQIYGAALYPNTDADIYRDDVFFKSLKTISHSITPDHPELGIPKKYHGECPWPSAQAEVAIINAYKAPRDKLACVMRCCQTIESLIRLASGRNVASADDITPVLVYVLLQANPPALLSNIQYISSFYGSRIEGEEAYWWTQFVSAVEFLKQLCNKH
ncbi:unnamed protein product [Bursaphelenchus xylophilus]|uniref:Receptor-mediated endocytosis protein 6 n=1 Tax=Bursaphelenchus xylophilus TaxID=6326 RepID=A0A1I7SMG6_BURXY|nr:unnamed protein product [Bursaphelenchus xylophilus]CAG9130190.1 unnamed protein product [Bursaphelenchus xylophilus]